MAKVFRILDRFQITGRGTVYMIKNDPDMSLHLEAILYDLKGHRFQIVGFEMFRYLISNIPFEELPVGILFRALDEVEAEGQIFVDSLNEDLGAVRVFWSHTITTDRNSKIGSSDR